MYYLIYRIKNKINGNYYIGSHKTKEINDTYLGSGNLIVKAIKKYGKDNFEKEYIFFAFDEESMKWAESQLVILNDVDKKSYNLIEGGGRPPTAKKGRKCNRPKFPNGYNYTHSEETKQKIREWTIQNQPMYKAESRKKLSDSRRGMVFTEKHRRNMSLSHKGKPSGFKGKKMSDEQKEKLRIAHLGKKLSEEHKQNISKSLRNRQ